MLKIEIAIVESVRSLLDLEGLGLADHEELKNENGVAVKYSEIEDEFRSKIVNFDAYTAISTAFDKVHSTRYVGTDSFYQAFKKEMTARGIDKEEMLKALDIYQKLDDKSDKDYEQSKGIHPDIDNVTKMPPEKMTGKSNDASMMEPPK